MLQAHSRPFLLDSDNALELCILMGLMLVIFADVALNQKLFPKSEAGTWWGSIKLKSLIVFVCVLVVFSLVIFHKKSNSKKEALSKVGLSGGSKSIGAANNDETSNRMTLILEYSDMQHNSESPVQDSGADAFDIASIAEEFDLCVPPPR